MPKFGTKNASFGYQHPRICLIATFREKMKMLKFGTENTLFGYFWD